MDKVEEKEMADYYRALNIKNNKLKLIYNFED